MCQMLFQAYSKEGNTRSLIQKSSLSWDILLKEKKELSDNPGYTIYKRKRIG